MKSNMLTEAGQFQKQIERDKNSKAPGKTPFCDKCGKPMKLEWSDSTTGIKQLWSCLGCSFYRVIDPRFTETEMLSGTSNCTIIGTNSI